MRAATRYSRDWGFYRVCFSHQDTPKSRVFLLSDFRRGFAGMNSPLFSASQIAEGLGIKRQTVHERLKDVQAKDGFRNGGRVKEWAFDDLPQDYQEKLRLRPQVQAGVYRDALDMLADQDNKPWQSPVPFNQVPEKFQWKAVRLQRALAIPLQRRNEIGLNLTELGVAEYNKVFTEAPIAGDRWNQLLRRTLARAGSREDWHRVEIYLEEAALRPAPVVSEAQQDRVVQYSHSELNGHE